MWPSCHWQFVLLGLSTSRSNGTSLRLYPAYFTILLANSPINSLTKQARSIMMGFVLCSHDTTKLPLVWNFYTAPGTRMGMAPSTSWSMRGMPFLSVCPPIMSGINLFLVFRVRGNASWRLHLILSRYCCVLVCVMWCRNLLGIFCWEWYLVFPSS